MWMHEYLERAQRIAETPAPRDMIGASSAQAVAAWNALEDDILGKLSISQCKALIDFVMETPCQGSMVILSMMPPEYDDQTTALAGC